MNQDFHQRSQEGQRKVTNNLQVVVESHDRQHLEETEYIEEEDYKCGVYFHFLYQFGNDHIKVLETSLKNVRVWRPSRKISSFIAGLKCVFEFLAHRIYSSLLLLWKVISIFTILLHVTGQCGEQISSVSDFENTFKKKVSNGVFFLRHRAFDVGIKKKLFIRMRLHYFRQATLKG